MCLISSLGAASTMCRKGHVLHLQGCNCHGGVSIAPNSRLRDGFLDSVYSRQQGICPLEISVIFRCYLYNSVKFSMIFSRDYGTYTRAPDADGAGTG
ncbi:High-affinity glucose transporter RGT2 [Fusarium oxysporum f. sp. albedinis]|nr:High-affinity glucose transporter RGT2 [Fusarium oxysporum f. sp. albedinis]